MRRQFYRGRLARVEAMTPAATTPEEKMTDLDALALAEDTASDWFSSVSDPHIYRVTTPEDRARLRDQFLALIRRVREAEHDRDKAEASNVVLVEALKPLAARAVAVTSPLSDDACVQTRLGDLRKASEVLSSLPTAATALRKRLETLEAELARARSAARTHRHRFVAAGFSGKTGSAILWRCLGCGEERAMPPHPEETHCIDRSAPPPQQEGTQASGREGT